MLLLTGNLFGSDVSQVTWFVTSLINGGVAKVPIARNWPLCVSSPKTIPLGIIVRERTSAPLVIVPVPPVPPVEPLPVVEP
jgi:hypothetical protein